MVMIMSRVVVKVAYHNPNSSSRSISGYANYIATREGVELRDQDTTYADYIATRPGVEKCGVHGLFSIEDRPVSLKEVSDELKEYKGNVWTVIVSLKRDDATNTGFDNGEAWRELLSSKADEIAKNFKLPPSEMNCYAAFHDAKDHPHIHMIVYSKNPSVYSGYHKESSLQNLKSIFTRDIFNDELSDIYKMKTAYRDELRSVGCEEIRKLASDIMAKKNTSSEVMTKFKELAQSISFIEGKKTYGYLPQDAKHMVDDLLKEIARDPRIVELYDKWYEQKALQQQFYNSNEVIKVPIEENDEFKSIRNAIVKEAAKVMVISNTATQIAVDDIVNLLCQVFVHQANEMELNQSENNSVIEEQKEVDEALGIKHS